MSSEMLHYCCPKCGKTFIDGPTWVANTLHACPGYDCHLVNVDNPHRKPVLNETLPWSERVNLFQIHPDAASRGDIARMAEELSAFMAKKGE